MTTESNMATAAGALVGMELANGWRVIDKIEAEACSTGGHFSVGYKVENTTGRVGFLKAIDLSPKHQSSDPARELAAVLNAFNHERDLLEKCKNRNLDHIVTAIGSGSAYVDDPFNQPVQYIIFEMADGDVRVLLDRFSEKLDWAWLLRSAHQVSVGLRQLHSIEYAHQDLKPSNVLVFENELSKIADLGCASDTRDLSPRSSCDIPGDMTYAPVELRYGHISEDWVTRRFGCDFYHLGSMLHFYATKVGMTQAIESLLPSGVGPREWGGTYAQAIDYVNAAFTQVLADFEECVPELVRSDVVVLVRELCNPDPNIRGDRTRGDEPKKRFDLERIVSRLDLVASRCESVLKEAMG